jgi:class 3 adenylate cyclase
MFADIVGFTAWSSMREPSQVFTLLETIYQAFDEIAQRRHIFKVETVGDCYVAVAGLPDPRKDHAVAMARFARDCVQKMIVLTKELEVELGPDTADLGIRVGIHSGPVTAGVLRGDRARFQLFGDTMNTCARVETSGQKNRIHASKEAATQICEFGKEHWVKARNEVIVAKGKGEIQTYWIELNSENANTVVTENSGSNESVHLSPEEEEGGRAGSGPNLNRESSNLEKNSATIPTGNADAAKNASRDDRMWRLIGWNADILAKIVKEIVARREASRVERQAVGYIRRIEREVSSSHTSVLSEVMEIVELPEYDKEIEQCRRKTDEITLSEVVQKQLREYVSTVAAMYRPNAFHNYEHASHVTMSVVKLLSRIVAPATDKDAVELHDHTYGITSDPLTQFAVVLSALIHDIDHPGVPNTVLVRENTTLAQAYQYKSVAEQNSVDLAWELLMEDCFKDLRGTLYVNEREFRRFRQLLVNAVMATDIMDKDLGALRKSRWEKAFSENAQRESSTDHKNRKATIVIEHLIQASDVAHTMQHWQIYRKWNERLFREMYSAYQDGRAEKDPSVDWYQGELGFFDYYIIPLAKKLKDCGVFGVSSDEYLNYAKQNRTEWEMRGRLVVAEMLQSAQEERAEGLRHLNSMAGLDRLDSFYQ